MEQMQMMEANELDDDIALFGKDATFSEKSSFWRSRVCTALFAITMFVVGIATGNSLKSSSVASPPHPSPEASHSPTPSPPAGMSKGMFDILDPSTVFSSSTTLLQFNNQKGYAMQPTCYDDQCIFVSEGDLFVANLKTPAPSVALRLTSGLGNELTPKISPDGKLLAFTATYTGHREAYIMKLGGQNSTKATRVTYTESRAGISTISSWTEDSSSIFVSALSLQSSLDDKRLYKVQIKNSDTIGKISPVELTQATEGFFDSQSGCFFFTRHSQSSNTKRYAGGTAESLWKSCDEDSQTSSEEVTGDYRGTSRHPALYSGRKLLFISDREAASDSSSLTISAVSNIWAIDLSTESPPQKLTTSCENKFGISSFSIDPISQNIIVRSGADLHLLQGSAVANALATNTPLEIGPRAEINILSDFQQVSERRPCARRAYEPQLNIL